MYDVHYGLKDLPFQISPDHAYFYPSRDHKRAMAYLSYGLGLRDGFIVITGEIGAGKTTIVSYLLSEIDDEKYICANIVTSLLGSKDTLRMVARCFDLPAEKRDKASLLKDVEQYLVVKRKEGKHVFLVVDEVQNMPFDAIEELRMLSNFQFEQRPLLQCIMLGQPEFRDKLVRPEMDQIRQRIVATCHIGPLDARETREYVEHRLRHVGWDNYPRFTDRTFEMIYEMTDGVPRRINVLCGRLMLYGAIEDADTIDESIVDAVAEEITSEFGSAEPEAEPSDPGETDDPPPPTEQEAEGTVVPLQPRAQIPPETPDDRQETAEARATADIEDGPAPCEISEPDPGGQSVICMPPSDPVAPGETPLSPPPADTDRDDGSVIYMPPPKRPALEFAADARPTTAEVEPSSSDAPREQGEPPEITRPDIPATSWKQDTAAESVATRVPETEIRATDALDSDAMPDGNAMPETDDTPAGTVPGVRPTGTLSSFLQRIRRGAH